MSGGEADEPFRTFSCTAREQRTIAAALYAYATLTRDPPEGGTRAVGRTRKLLLEQIRAGKLEDATAAAGMAGAATLWDETAAAELAGVRERPRPGR